jgi:hypothetical protein
MALVLHNPHQHDLARGKRPRPQSGGTDPLSDEVSANKAGLWCLFDSELSGLYAESSPGGPG